MDTNSVPDVGGSLTALTSLIPAQYHGYVVAGIALLPWLLRFIKGWIANGLPGALAGVFLGTNTPGAQNVPVQQAPSQGPTLRLLLLGTTAALLTLAPGCSSTSLAPGGAYAPASSSVTTNADGSLATNTVATAAPDLQLYQADLAYKTAYDAVDSALQLELSNRASIALIAPGVKPALDKIRPTVWQVDQEWALARAAYTASPTPAGLTALQTIVGQIQQLLSAAQAAIGPVLVSPVLNDNTNATPTPSNP